MINKILVPVDGSSASMRGSGEAIRLVKQTKGTLRLLHAVEELLGDYSSLGSEFYDQWVLRGSPVPVMLVKEHVESTRTSNATEA